MAINNLYMLAGLGAVGAIGGGVYIAYPRSSPSISTVKNKLKSEKYILLTDKDTQHWQTVLNKYNAVENRQNKRFTNKEGTISLEELKKDCESAINKEEENPSSYGSAKLWCTVPRTIKERLGDLGISVLKTSGDDENTGDKSKWKGLESDYRGKGNNDIKSFQLGTSSDTSWQELRNKCKEHIDKDKWDSEYDYYLNKVGRWCSNRI